jgi:hypothetical protein
MAAIAAEMLVREVWLKYIVNIEVHFVGYLYITDMTDAGKVERIPITQLPFSLTCLVPNN